MGHPSLWYKDAILYELHVKSFSDGNDDGVGDFAGLIQKMGYLRDLGVTALWLLPFYPSPRLDDGYDIADYYGVHPDYGCLADFKRFLREAHRRGIRVIIELVINHTSDQHAWFQRSRRARPGSPWRDYYVWSDTSDRYREARIIFTDFEGSNWSWDPVAQAYYWHRFYHHQPDLNYDNPRVRREVFRVLDFWFKMGVDGMRLDAVPYLFEREGTNCENLPETHAFLKELRAHVDRHFEDRLLLGEANQWPEDAAAYFGQGDECHMAFHFPLMPRLFMALQLEDRFPVIDILEQSMNIPPTCQWGMFLRNHDELTLEMVTDEERDYMYKVFAQDPRARINAGIRRRLAPLLSNNRRRIELMNSLLFSLPGTPILYYGDELGMGDNYYLGDRDGVRTPMQWSPDRNGGFSKANPHQLYLPAIIDSEYHFATVNVENQARNPSSLLWFMRRLIALRQQAKALSRGTLEFVYSDNPKVLTFVRQYEDQTVLVAANLSRYSQVTHIDLKRFSGHAVREMFGASRFPTVTESPYVLTHSPHSFFWFHLDKPAAVTLQDSTVIPGVRVPCVWSEILDSDNLDLLMEVLQTYMQRCRWFGGKGRPIQGIHVEDGASAATSDHPVHVLRLQVSYADGPSETYLLPIGLATGEAEIQILGQAPKAVIARIETDAEKGLVYEAVHDPAFRASLLRMIAQARTRKATNGLMAHQGSRFQALLGDKSLPLDSQPLGAEQSNTSLVYDRTFVLKLYRRLEPGVHPDVELTQALTERTAFTHLPAYAGSLQWRQTNGSPIMIGMLQAYVSHETDGWSYMLDAVAHFLTRAKASREAGDVLQNRPASILEVSPEAIPEPVLDLIGSMVVGLAIRLGQRTAELHRALASLTEPEELTPEPSSLLFQKSLHQSIRGFVSKVLADLDKRRLDLAEPVRTCAGTILDARRSLLDRVHQLVRSTFQGQKIRTHGDYHLGQVLYTGKDFVIIDFEGEPTRSMSERRLKHSALRDVAGMVRSFHYAAYKGILSRTDKEAGDLAQRQSWADVWYTFVSGAFLHAYFEAVEGCLFLPSELEHRRLLLEAFVIEKVVYELNYELNNRPDWLCIPVQGLQRLIRDGL